MLNTLIIPVSSDVPQDIITEVYRSYCRVTIPINIQFSYCDEPFSLARARNRGAQRAVSEWLIFSDVDMVYEDDLFARMLALGVPAVVGASRADVISTDLSAHGEFYHCSCAPLLIRRDLFESVGGYCEDYVGWGYEDSQFSNKLPSIVNYDSKGYHMLSIHHLVSAKPSWGWGLDRNRALFDQHMILPLKTRIAVDKANYEKRSVIVRSNSSS